MRGALGHIRICAVALRGSAASLAHRCMVWPGADAMPRLRRRHGHVVGGCIRGPRTKTSYSSWFLGKPAGFYFFTDPHT
jgi:hypothetical protein